MRVLAIDPGERCGYCTAEVIDGATYTRSDSSPSATVEKVGDCKMLTIQTFGIASLKDTALMLHEKIGDYDALVYEDYRIRPSSLNAHVGSNVPTLQMIGMIRLCAWLNPTLVLAVQQPSKKRTADRIINTNPIFANAKRIIDGAPARHDDAHHTDAIRHLCVWFFDRFI